MRREKRVIGRFTATTWTDEDIHFIVYENNTMDCPTIEKKNIQRMIIKPRFELYGIRFSRSYKTKYIDRYVSDFNLVKEYDIDPELFSYLKNMGMIRYSTEMAYLYDFEDKKGYDYKDKTRAFKWAKTKGPILKKQKRGHFNY